MSLPHGRSTRCISVIAALPSGMQHSDSVQTTVSKLAAGNRSACASATLDVTPRNVTGLLDALEASGHAARTAHPTDRRASLVTLTNAGQAVAALQASRHELRPARRRLPRRPEPLLSRYPPRHQRAARHRPRSHPPTRRRTCRSARERRQDRIWSPPPASWPLTRSQRPGRTVSAAASSPAWPPGRSAGARPWSPAGRSPCAPRCWRRGGSPGNRSRR